MATDVDKGSKAEEQCKFLAQLQATLNVIPAYTWYAAPSGGLTFVNKRTADYLGLPEDHPLRFGIDVGVQWDAHILLLHPDDQERSRKSWSTCLRTGEFSEESFRVRNAQGNYRWFRSRVEPLRASDGTLLQWVGVNADIEELKSVEDALRESEYKLRQIIDAVPGFLWSADPDSEPTHLNQRLLEYYGIGFEDFKRSGWQAFAHPDDVPETAMALSYAFQTGTSFQAVHRLRRSDGEFRWHHSRGEPLRDREGHIIQWYGLSVDIDETKKAEDRLRRSEAHLAEAQRLSHTGASAYNATAILYWSEETYRIFGFDPRDGVPDPEAVWQRIHPDDRSRVRAEVEDALHGKGGFSSEFRIVLPDGTVKYLESIRQPVFSTNGEPVEVVATQIDVTERKRAEEAYREAQMELAHANRVATLGQLTASITHEVNQPITAAVTYALAARRFLNAEPPNFHEVDDALSLIIREGNRAGEVVGRVRALIKKAPTRKDAVEINDAILEIIALTRAEAANNSVSVQTRLAEDLARVQGDRVQLQQVLLNLIINAIEAMRDVGEKERQLLIVSRNEPEGVSVEVRDSGLGLAPASLDRVFEAFYTTKPGGLGLGLSICRSIIEAHNGQLWASPNVPRGTIFRFSAPAHPSAAP
ncbi:PAS domain-containing protein [Bradyrhizobium sp. C-145]|uniref:PAS domain-containing protein n=1 Tax=Bradyrhizobium sp. C-145 TaxID=574727 RepID=UPI00201B4CB5|nr:PAS domain-containing protein [Bradyrhizobium sp. C-145]UQR63203.1 PAS domain-containing protein [Bradyrhizobium sp. C-145]